MARQQSRLAGPIRGTRAQKGRRPTAKPRTRSRAQIKQILDGALRAEFPNDTVDISDGYRDNIHILVVSRRFDTVPEKAKPDMLWSIIDSTVLTKTDKSLISLVLPVSPSEIKRRGG